MSVLVVVPRSTKAVSSAKASYEVASYLISNLLMCITHIIVNMVVGVSNAFRIIKLGKLIIVMDRREMCSEDFLVYSIQIVFVRKEPMIRKKEFQ